MKPGIPLEQQLLESVVGEAWRQVGIRHHHGVNVFLNALRSASSLGIGEFLDLLPLIDWCKKIGLNVIQLLPLNDSSLDPSPYNAISSCALNPIFLKLSVLPHVQEYPALIDGMADMTRYNLLPRVAYNEVLAAKMRWLHDYYQAIAPRLKQDSDFLHFQSHFRWVETYALFKTLLIFYGYRGWDDWPKDILTPEKYPDLLKEYREEIDFHTALQFFCFQQLQEVRHHAERNSIFLMGDIPLIINRNSADVWTAPHFFDLLHTAGAPPDQYNADGQNWGFPLFNWETMQKANHSFWSQRLQIASQFFHLHRIDHAVGFFRIWGIPLNLTTKEGYFIPKDPAQALEQGTRILKFLASSSTMLPIAEDLGSVPEEVRKCLTEMGIPGIRVIRWEADWSRDSNPYLPLDAYSPLTMSCVSTHDSETLGGWWEGYPHEASQLAQQKGWSYGPLLLPDQRFELLKDCHHTTSLFHINLLQEYLALFPELIASHSQDERINVPGKIIPANWTYRYRPTLETLTTHEGLLSAMQSLVPK